MSNENPQKMPVFITNRISTTTSKTTLSDLLKTARTQAALTKTASAPAKPAAKPAQPVKKAEKDKAEGETSGQLAPKANPQNDPKVVDEKKKGGSPAVSKKDNEADGKDSGQPKAEAKLVNTPKVVEQGSQKYVKIANLTGKQKEALRKVWSVYWPEDFIAALLTDK